MRNILFIVLSAVTAGCLAFALACTESDGSSEEEESGSQQASGAAASSSSTSTTSNPSALIQPSDFTYVGAFRLPQGGERPQTFAYGGNAMTFNPDGDSGGAGDGYPGSLFITGHDRLPYGELPDGSRVAEISIPAAVASKNVSALNQAGVLQGLRVVTGDLFRDLDEIPRVGMTYLSTSATGAWIHLAWGQHLQDEGVPTHACFRPSLASPDTRGAWFVDNASVYGLNGYMFEIPETWASQHVSGRRIATGRYRDGGWSGQGPALFAYVPWSSASGALPASGARVPATTLLRYVSSLETANLTARSLRGYQHPDEWEGGAWLTTIAGKSAVLFAGTKSVGKKFWYGWINPAGPDRPCVETAMVNEFTTCYQSSGEPCPAEDLRGCSGHNDYRGWWTTRFEAQFLLYDPGDLARVASGAMAPDQPQPYAAIGIDGNLVLPGEPSDADMVGRGVQRRFRIGDIAFDRANGLLYVLELYADGALPIVHVWRIR